MKYMFLLTRGSWQENGSDEEIGQVFAKLEPWFGERFANGTFVEGHQLQSPATATTVVLEAGDSTLVDRPLLEAKEAIGGYVIVDVADLDAALAVVRSLPVPDGKVEVRPVLER
jgi:hypothetical protein